VSDAGFGHAGLRALARAAVSGLGLAGIIAGYDVAMRFASGRAFTRAGLLEPLILGLSLGLVAAPVALVELTAARRGTPGPKRDGAALVLATIAAFVGLVLATLQFTYTFTLVNVGSWQSAAVKVADEGRQMLQHRRDYASIFTAAAFLFGVGIVGRLRGYGLARQTFALLGAVALVAVPILFTDRRSAYMGIDTMGVWLVLGACVLPLATALSEQLERRLVAWITGEETPVALGPSRPLGARVGRAVSILVIALAASGLGFGTKSVLRDPRRARFDPSPQVVALMPAFKAWEEGKLSPAEVAALVSRAISVEYRVRPRIAPGDPLCVDRRCVLALPPSDYALDVTTVFALDGTQHGPFPLGNVASWYELVLVDRTESPATLLPQGGFTLGRHEIAFTSQLVLKRKNAPVWARTVPETVPFEVVPEGGEPVRLVPGDLDESAIDLSLHTGTKTYAGLSVAVSRPEVALAGVLEVHDESGQLLGTHELFAPTDRWTWESVSWPTTQAITSPLTVTFRPDPKVAIAKSATVREILGTSFERKVPPPAPPGP
jgi:hypothetical protein